MATLNPSIDNAVRDSGDDAARAWPHLRSAAWLSLGVHFVAGLAMALILRHGLETNPVMQDRMRFLVTQRWVWILGWLSWQLAALSILWFFVNLARAHVTSRSVLLDYSVFLVAAAMVPDLIAESIEIGVMPELAEQRLSSVAEMPPLMESVHRIAMILTGYLANGLYTVATIIAVWATRRHYVRWVRCAGYAVGVFGCALSASVLVNFVPGMVWANVGLVPAIVIWQVGVALDASQHIHRSVVAQDDSG